MAFPSSLQKAVESPPRCSDLNRCAFFVGLSERRGLWTSTVNLLEVEWCHWRKNSQNSPWPADRFQERFQMCVGRQSHHISGIILKTIQKNLLVLQTNIFFENVVLYYASLFIFECRKEENDHLYTSQNSNCVEVMSLSRPLKPWVEHQICISNCFQSTTIVFAFWYKNEDFVL